MTDVSEEAAAVEACVPWEEVRWNAIQVADPRACGRDGRQTSLTKRGWCVETDGNWPWPATEHGGPSVDTVVHGLWPVTGHEDPDQRLQ